MAPLLRIVKFTKNLWPYYLLVSFLSVFVSLLAQAPPLLIGGIVGQLEKIAEPDFSRNLVIIFVGLIFVQSILNTILTNVQGYFGDILATKVRRDLSNKYFQHLMSLPQAYFDNELSGKITARLNRSIVQISSFVQMMGNNFASFILTAVIGLTIVAFISWPIALALVTLYPIFTWLTVRTSNKWMKFQEKINANTDEAFGRFQEVISQVKVVKSFVREKTELSFFSKRMDKIVELVYPQSRLWHGKDIQRKLVLNVVMGVVYLMIVWQATNNTLSLAEAVTLIQLSTMISFPIFIVTFLVENIQKAIADSKDYFEVMEIAPAIQDVKGAKRLKVTKGEIIFKDVDFAFGEEEIFSGINIDIKPGTKVALVGESGAGKSTLSNLLMRLYEPTKGTISIDGQDISKVSQKSLREQIGVVFQDASLFSGDIFENITYGKSGATKAQVKKAAKAANAHEFIMGFKEGYSTLIGERGLKLSGGQKQRLSIARAIMKNSPILILDEATSSLDNKSELLVQEALENLMHKRTTIIIAHRLSTIQNVDQIITLIDGQIDEVGSPEELAKTKGIYSQLLKVQTASNPEERKEALAQYGIVA